MVLHRDSSDSLNANWGMKSLRSYDLTFQHQHSSVLQTRCFSSQSSYFELTVCEPVTVPGTARVILTPSQHLRSRGEKPQCAKEEVEVQRDEVVQGWSLGRSDPGGGHFLLD